MEAGKSVPVARRYGLTFDDCNLEDFRSLVERKTSLSDYPLARTVEENILIYDAKSLVAAAAGDGLEAALAEIVAALSEGPGVAVFKGAFSDASVLDRASDIFSELINEQHRSNLGGADHFAKPGANDRIWNSLEKHCLADPESFARYFANDIVALVSRAWLGPGYQITAQVNRVNPGGAAQSAHRDYHLGFMKAERSAEYPVHIHRLSPLLTLQGAVAHCDMPLESGPTLFLPYSQRYEAGYLATAHDDFKKYFDEHHVQLPLEKGDVVFFNPALFHAAGQNRSKDILRVANLLQVSSAFGRAMETVNRTAMCAALYPTLKRLQDTGALGADGIANAIAASAEGYSFPTNLDRDPPIGGLAPKTQAEMMQDALKEAWDAAQFGEALETYDNKRAS